MNMFDRFNNIMRGEFKVVAKNKKGEKVYEYEDNNVVVNDARPVTAFLVNQAITDGTGARRPEYDNDGYDNVTDFYNKLINPQNFQVSFIKMGGGYSRKRSFCSDAGVETQIIPEELKVSGDRDALYRYIDYGTTLSATIPDSWATYGTTLTQEPYHSSSLLYPRKTDTDLYDRDYQWSKRIRSYNYGTVPAGYTGTYRATFTTVMRFREGNGPEYDCEGGQQTGANRLYEYREAGLFVGMMPWQMEAQEAPTDPYYSIVDDHRAAYQDVFGFDNEAGTIDSVISSNLREYRFWDGYSHLIGANWGAPNEPRWPNVNDNQLTWDSMLEFRGAFSSINASKLKNDYLQGQLYKGNYMVARKTFPTITKTSDLEFTITWSLVFG